MEISGAYVQLSVNDGTTMRAWVARPKEEGTYPGLLVFQEAFGVNAHIRDVAGRFAREGFVAVAPELFHRTGSGVEVRYDDFPSAAPHMRAARDSVSEARARLAIGMEVSARKRVEVMKILMDKANRAAPGRGRRRVRKA